MQPLPLEASFKGCNRGDIFYLFEKLKNIPVKLTLLAPVSLLQRLVWRGRLKALKA
jgi:hypothetical protein